MNISITKDNLDKIYEQTFDIQRFKREDPCGVVYELTEHTDNQLDIEIGALLVAAISWGNRKAIVPTARNMIANEMHWHPAQFILNAEYEHSYTNAHNNCVYRTLNVDTFKATCRNIHNALKAAEDKMQKSELQGKKTLTMEMIFDNLPTKQVVVTLTEWLSPAKIGTMDKSACKRICMFVRWMTRKTSPDLNIWKSRTQTDLYAIMDTHILQLTQPILKNKRPTWKACEELTSIFKDWCPEDPLKYDIALMTLGTRKE